MARAPSWSRRTGLVYVLVVCAVASCVVRSGDPEDPGEDPYGDGEPEPDSGEPTDAGPLDSSTPTVPDAGRPDAGETSDAGTADASIPDASVPGPSVTPGAPDRLLLKGTILTPDLALEGEVLVEGPLITCVAAGSECSTQLGAIGATVISTEGIITPGLIDTHNHILFDIFDADDWSPQQLYQNHTEWTAEPRYQAMLDVKQCLANDSQGKPAWCANTPYGSAAGSLRCEMDKYGELKGLVAGTTSIVGLPGTSAPCFSSLARSIDVSQSGLGGDRVQTSALFPPSTSSGDAVCENFDAGTTLAYLIHCGEGVDAKSLSEFEKLGTLTTDAGCLIAPQTTITHGVAFGAPEFSAMARQGVKLTWSPASNASLYGQTADIPSALDAGVTVALAPDWSMGGSQNLLDELRFARAWDESHWGKVLTDRDLLEMTTTRAAKVLALETRIGRIEPGYLADLAVFEGDRSNPYAALLAATPKNVILTIVGGTVLYGEAALVSAGPLQPGCEALEVCGRAKFLCAANTQTTDKLNQTYATFRAALEQALAEVDLQLAADGGADAGAFSPLTPLVKCP